MKISIQNKVYKITFGATSFVEKQSMKTLKNVDHFGLDVVTVIAKDVYSALDYTSKYLLALEKKYKKENLLVWVESVELLNVIDDIETL